MHYYICFITLFLERHIQTIIDFVYLHLINYMRSFLPNNASETVNSALDDFEEDPDIQNFVNDKVKKILAPQSQNGQQENINQKGDTPN